MAPQVGWIGLGNMGRGMCKNLVEKGKLDKPLLIFNRTTSRADELASKLGHCKVAGSITDLVKESDIIFYCLGDDFAVTDTVSTILEAGSLQGKLLVDCSTIHPDSTEDEATKFEKAGAEFVACPVFGAPAAAEAGQLIMMPAGPKTAIDKIKPYCTGVMGRVEIDFVDKPARTSSLMKLVGNTMILGMVENLSEGHVVAEKTGLGTDKFHEFISHMFPGPYTAYSNRMLSGDYYNRPEPLFAVDLARKDARHAQDLAKKSGVTMKNVELGDSYLKQVKEFKGAKGDLAGMYGAKRVEAGLSYENGA